MDELVERLRYKQQVADRLAGQGKGPSRPRCWFCASIRPWFMCDCPKAILAQAARDAGKREGYPRWNATTNCIENLDAETIAFNEALGFKRYAPPSVTPAAAKSVTPEAETAAPVTPAERMRRMRQRRAKQKEGG